MQGFFDMRQLVFRLGILLLFLSLGSCSYVSGNMVIQKREKRIMEAQSIPPLKIPPGISSSEFYSKYPVPPRTYSEPTEVSLIPPGLKV
jgi:uncharacterized lipoprotein